MKHDRWFLVTVLLLFFIMPSVPATAQQNGVDSLSSPAVFDRLTRAINEYRIDSSRPPDDRLTRKIIELRSLRGGFNVNELMEYKIEEERQKKEKPVEALDKMAAFFSTGIGRTWLDNAAIWIYRKNFSLREIRQMVRFYKTAGGKKLSRELPLIIVQLLKAGETIVNKYTEMQKQVH